MVAENDSGDDGRELCSSAAAGGGGGMKSPWKTPAPALEAPTEAPVMGAETWPALAEAQRPKSNPDLSKPQTQAVSAVPPPNANAPPPSSAGVQVCVSESECSLCVSELCLYDHFIFLGLILVTILFIVFAKGHTC